MSDTSEQADVPEELRSGSGEGEPQTLEGAAGAATPAHDEPAPGGGSQEGSGDLAADVADAVEGDGGTMPG